MRAQYEYAVCYVYALVDPRDGKEFYIGKTVQQTGRYESHCRDCLGAPYPRVQELKAVGLNAAIDAAVRVASEGVSGKGYPYDLGGVEARDEIVEALKKLKRP